MAARSSLGPTLVVLGLSFLAGCASGVARDPHPQRHSYPGLSASSFAKGDLEIAVEIHLEESFASLQTLMEKLYKRNPREWRKSTDKGWQEMSRRVFEDPREMRFEQLGGHGSVEALRLAFRDDYAGDRVLAFIYGLKTMLVAAHGGKTEFFLLDDLDPQKLYDAARNVEIAVWKLSNARNAQDELYLLSNEGAGAVPNLSFEREFGKLIANQDATARIVAQKRNRTIVRVIQNLATAVFLPI